MSSYSIVIAVGPEPKEIERLADLIDSIRAHECAACHFVMVDDAPSPRELHKGLEFPANWIPATVASLRPRDGVPKQYKSKGIGGVVLKGLAHAARQAADARFVLKLDTDSLVIGPFVDKIAAALDAHPDVGMLGAYDKTPNGEVRDISKNASRVRELYRGDGVVRRIKNIFANDELATISRHIGAARTRGYEFGEHCLGGGYALSNEFLKRMLAAGYLDNPAIWHAADCAEDVMVGMYTRAVGLRLMSFVGPGEVFGVRYKGLADTPQRLLERGYSVIHALKNDPTISEAEIRSFFRDRRISPSPVLRHPSS